MAVSRENDRRIPMPMAIALSGLNQLLDLIGGQMFLGPQGPIGLPGTFHFSPFGGTNLRFGFVGICASNGFSLSTMYFFCGMSARRL